MIEIKAPTICKTIAPQIAKTPTVFIAGGINGCLDWQKEYVQMFEDTNIVLVNPRRDNYPVGDKDAADAQVAWEFQHLQNADAISFWFPAEGPCMTTLYELGYWAGNYDKPIFVGIHPDYVHRGNILRQLSHIDGLHKIVKSLSKLAKQVKKEVPKILR